MCNNNCPCKRKQYICNCCKCKRKREKKSSCHYYDHQNQLCKYDHQNQYSSVQTKYEYCDDNIDSCNQNIVITIKNMNI
jgi:hypothetical protein